MKSYKVNLELFDKAVHREYRIIQRFFDMGEAEEFKTALRILEIKFNPTLQLKMNY
ncbi:hypothetical protein [Escherichia phage NiC89]|nr:hypothetical protein [Escherichia phage NiC89]